MGEATIVDRIISELRTNPNSTATAVAHAICEEPSNISSRLYRLYKSRRVYRSQEMPWKYRVREPLNK